MAYEISGLTISKLGVIGSGQIGPDIALHFSKVLHDKGVRIVVVDVAQQALDQGRAKMHKKIDRGVQSKAFSPAMAQAMKDAVTFTSDYQTLTGVDFVVEAATEDVGLKQRIFKQVEELAAKKAVLASNSSHLEPEAIFEPLANRARTLVIHYFFPAERNPALEIVPGADTDPSLIHSLMVFYERIGKVPIRVKSRYGYAVDPIFEGLFQASALCVQEGLGSVKEVDQVACRALGLSVGSFTAMNLTGGNPITDHGLDMSGEKLNPWFGSPKLLKEAMASGEKWDVAARAEVVEIPAEKEKKISEALQGAYFGLVGQIIDSGIVSISDLEMALEIALDITPAHRLMNQLGISQALTLVQKYHQTHPRFEVPHCLEAQAQKNKPWEIEFVRRHDVGSVAWIRIRRPKVLNALSPQVYSQLLQQFKKIEEDPAIRAAVLSGFGTKAFVSGADIQVLARVETPEQGEKLCHESRLAGDYIEKMKKPVVCALNGLAFGGGLELAMCCSARLVARGLKLAACQPEVNLGIIPGAGGTQRLPRLIGVEKAAELMRDARPISGQTGVELGLFQQEIDGDKLIEQAIEYAKTLADGTQTASKVSPEPMDTPDTLPAVELGHLSRAIDGILCKTIIEGCRKSLDEGLRFESKMFGECVKTEDMRIGLTNFIQNGPRKKAEFKNA